MNRQVLLIGDFKSFMVNAIETDLSKEGFDVLHVLPDVTAIDRLEKRPDIYLMYLDGAAVDRDLCVYLNDRIDEDEIALCVIGDYNLIMPSCNISGGVVIGNNNFLGVQSAVLQYIKIGNNTRLGANSVVMRKTKDGYLYIGNPAKRVEL